MARSEEGVGIMTTFEEQFPSLKGEYRQMLGGSGEPMVLIKISLMNRSVDSLLISKSKLLQLRLRGFKKNAT